MKNKAQEYGIHICVCSLGSRLENCEPHHDICLRDGSEVCRKIVMIFLTCFLAQETELSFSSEQHEHSALFPKACWYG